MKEGVNIKPKNIKKDCEELWAKNKYYVLSKSQKVYLEIREYLKEKDVDILFLNEKIQRARNIEESKKDFNNAILHVWGYFKKEATEIEKQGLCNLLQEYMIGKNNQKSVIEYINILLKKYPNEYLQKSTLLTGEQDETVA
ncbi:YbgA family protein [Fusobacterium hwasookii]|uniref:YbgA family protein n=1 Tax=Fusobacterium hwasookii TaxID=1583098 RepID=UPI0004B52312